MSIFSKTQKRPTLEELRAKVESLENAVEPLKARRKELREAFAVEMATDGNSKGTGAELAAITAQIEATPRALELLRDEILALEISEAEARAAQKRAAFLAFRKTVEPKLEAPEFKREEQHRLACMKYLLWGSISMSFPWPSIEVLGYPITLSLINCTHATHLWKILTYEAITVLV